MASTQKGKNDPELCPRCTDVATNLCVICKNIKYCSPECQQADWASHKSLCKSFKDFAGPRPAPNMRRVVVFLPEEDKPRFMWAPLSDDGRGSMCTLPHEFLDYKPKPLFWKQLTTSTNVWTGKKLGYVVQVWYDDNFVMNFQDVEPPPALQAATQGLEKTEWRGPMVTCCHGLPKEDWDDGEDDSHPLGTVKTSDMDMRAYSQATSMIIDHGNEKARQFCKGPKLQCIEVACGEDGEGTGPHRVIHMPRTHPKLREPEASEVSKRVGEPLYTFAVDSEVDWDTPMNERIMALHVWCDPALDGADMFGTEDMLPIKRQRSTKPFTKNSSLSLIH